MNTTLYEKVFYRKYWELWLFALDPLRSLNFNEITAPRQKTGKN